LASIPMFYLSFMKMSTGVRKAIICLQRNFLWGSSASGGSKIPWISWGGGLGGERSKSL
jgi:hypothetical protein